jgi:hypothetical protein
MSELEDVLGCVCFEVGVYVGCGFALCMRDECEGRVLGADGYA